MTSIITDNSSSVSGRPLVTFVIYAYNEERYIREAIKSAFFQTYSPMEIVLSDDGSEDRTFEIMKEMAASYQGPHKIILNHNQKNMGIGSQLNACVAKSRGELVLLANGDDISLPERTAVTVEAWLESGKAVHAAHSDVEVIDEQGRSLGWRIRTDSEFVSLEDGVRRRFGGVLAASLALSREVFEVFGPLPDNLILEDSPLFMRALILGGGKAVHLETPLVQYRVHRDNISQTYAGGEFEVWRKRHRQNAIWHKSEGVKAYLQMLRDMHASPAENWSLEDLKRARWAAMEKLMENAIMRDYYLEDSTVSTWQRFLSLARLFKIVIKTAVKRAIPVIEYRNDRWHYKQLKNQQGN